MKILKDGKEIFEEKKKLKKKRLIILGSIILVTIGILSIFVFPGGFIQEQISYQQQMQAPVYELEPLMDEPQREAPLEEAPAWPQQEQTPEFLDQREQIPEKGGQQEVYTFEEVYGEPVGGASTNLWDVIKDILSLLSTGIGILVGIKTLKENKKNTQKARTT